MKEEIEEPSKREFEGVWIPRLVYLNRDISWNAKIIWVEIHSFTSAGKKCYFSNEYLRKFLGCSTAQITRYLNELKEIGWIEDVGFDGRKRYLRSLIASSKMIRQPEQELFGSVSKNDSHKKSNIKIPIDNGCIKVFNYFSGVRKKYGFTGQLLTSKQRLSAISARIKEFSFEDCILVIDFKFAEWNGNAEMRKYLTPDTIFRASNFTKYVEAVKNAPVKDWTEQKIFSELYKRKGELGAQNSWPG